MIAIQPTLTNQEQRALESLRRRLLQDPRISRIVLFGSAARGERDPESDIDILVFTHLELGHVERHRTVPDVVTEINWEFGTNIAALTVSEFSWQEGLLAVSALRHEVERDGVPL